MTQSDTVKVKANLDWLTDDLAVGGDLSFNQDTALAQVYDILNQDIDLIIDMRVEANDAAVWANFESIEYVHLGTDDAIGHNIPAGLFDLVVTMARRAAEDGKKVFIHCHMGINRAPSMAYAVLLDRGYGIKEAFDLIREKRPIAGIAYAMDALKAHQRRQGIITPSYQAVCADEQGVLRRHVAKVIDPATRMFIKRAMAEGHARDERERWG